MNYEGYDVAQVCLNGHVVNASTRRYPVHNKTHCTKCGAATTTTCPACGRAIQGAYHIPGAFLVSDFHAPAFCHECGKAYPWIETKLKAAQELAAEMEGLTNEDRRVLSQSLDDLVKDSPMTLVAVTRFKRIIAKVGKAGADAIRDVVIDVVSETAKRAIWG